MVGKRYERSVMNAQLTPPPKKKQGISERVSDPCTCSKIPRGARLHQPVFCLAEEQAYLL